MTTDNEKIRKALKSTADKFGRLWPLHSFVTANPLSGLEDLTFHQAVKKGQRIYGGRGYPTPERFESQMQAGRIDKKCLRRNLQQAGYDLSPDESLAEMSEASYNSNNGFSWTDADRMVNATLSKWLAAFLDEGQAEWEMPERQHGFYEAFRQLARYDNSIPENTEIERWPEEPVVAILRAVGKQTKSDYYNIFERQLAALPGWSGFIIRRQSRPDSWQHSKPIELSGYVAVRLQLARQYSAPISPGNSRPNTRANGVEISSNSDKPPLFHVWLESMEQTYRRHLLDALEEERNDRKMERRPEAQLVFCIDTRSEIIRRSIEQTGPYETFGYAGFFGVPMDYLAYESNVRVGAYPPLLKGQHQINEIPAEHSTETRHCYHNWMDSLESSKSIVKRLKSNPATAFSFVEKTGLAYGTALVARTLLPDFVASFVDWVNAKLPAKESFIDLELEPGEGDMDRGITLQEQIDYAESAFDLMGWTTFSPVVVFVGHAAETANNPFDSSLDCGACAANPGGPNARVLAQICQKPQVQQALRHRGFEIPEDTLFMAGEHNTTTDEITIFATDVPETHADRLESLKADLENATERAARERTEMLGARRNDSREVKRRSVDWAQTRPEWGLAGNASFIIGPRNWTSNLDLGGRAFLHSYDWQQDESGEALEAIMVGPMVVTQWINNQYYFSTVDNRGYGSGSKITQNPVGNIGVYQGNGGDIGMGLPLESVWATDKEPFHQPMRLTTFVESPLDRVNEVLARNDKLTELLDHGWLHLVVVDPEKDRKPFKYSQQLSWSTIGRNSEKRATIHENATTVV